MDITAIDYLRAKFGEKFHYKYDVYPTGSSEFPRYSDDLDEIMDEFKRLLLANEEDIVQTNNPKSKEWVIVDKKEGRVLANLESPLNGVKFKLSVTFSEEETQTVVQEFNQILGMLQNMLRPINNNAETEFPVFKKIVDLINQNKKQFNK